mgnify:CR=1 FL=1
MIDIDEFLPRFRGEAGNVPQPVAFARLRDAAREFCRSTKAWTTRLTVTFTDPDRIEIASLVEQDAEFFELTRKARFKGTTEADAYDIERITPFDLDQRHPGWIEDADVAETVQFVTSTDHNLLRVYPKAAGTLYATAVLIPDRQAETLPEFLLSDHEETICRGAAAMALTTPQAEYANPQRGLDLRNQFQQAIDTMTMRAQRSDAKGRRNTRGRYF